MRKHAKPWQRDGAEEAQGDFGGDASAPHQLEGRVAHGEQLQPVLPRRDDAAGPLDLAHAALGKYAAQLGGVAGELLALQPVAVDVLGDDHHVAEGERQVRGARGGERLDAFAVDLARFVRRMRGLGRAGRFGVGVCVGSGGGS